MQIRLRFDDASQEQSEVTQLGTNRFRLEETPLSAPEPLYPGDTIEAQPLQDGSYRFGSILERSPMSHYSWVVPRSFVDSAAYHEFTKSIEAAGGKWEGIAGGILRVHLPQRTDVDPEIALQRFLSSEAGEA